ncbi:hypothetical protein Q8F55_007980 [Vanrija albida]|uniref:Late embryogenesis abundant protein LEA-2 subgroup domain-containing protein n=1 Tax=Vanrija albida TaxID=181172 RepID=A0ABR3PV14_9TREE
MSNYKDPYQNGGSEYLQAGMPPGAAAPQHGYDNSAHPDAGYQYSAQYNSYTSTTPSTYEKNNDSTGDLDGVHALGELGPGERERPGRMGLGQPTSSFAAMGPPPRSTGILRMWRKDERGKQWTKGGGFRSTGRLVFCCLVVAILIIVSIVLAVLLYIRPPSVVVQTFEADANKVTANAGQFQANITLEVSVNNPNWFNADFKEINVDIHYPGVPNGQFGNGFVKNANFKGYTRSTFAFPLMINYSLAQDPNQLIITDLNAKCGNTQGQITIDYTIRLWLKILGVSIKPNIASSQTITCPLTGKEIAQVLGKAITA